MPASLPALSWQNTHARLTAAAMLGSLLTGLNPAAALQAGDSRGDWKAACPVSKPSAKPDCYIFRNIAAEQTGARVLHNAVGRVAAHGGRPPSSTLPPGVSLPPGVTLVIEDYKTQRLPYDTRVSAGRKTGLAPDDQTWATLRDARQAHALFT